MDVPDGDGVRKIKVIKYIRLGRHVQHIASSVYSHLFIHGFRLVHAETVAPQNKAT